MTKNKIYKSELSASAHEIAEGLLRNGLINKETMREFDDACLTKVRDWSASEILELRKREEVSQDVFAHYLNISKDSISKWERGLKKPNGAAAKLLALVEKNGLSAIA